jgi:hypothetical protein
MEELWTKYGDTMEKPFCLGVLYGEFTPEVEESSKNGQVKMEASLILYLLI